MFYLKYKKRFLEDIIENRIDVYRKTKAEINDILKTNSYPKIEDSYNYLTSLQISSFNFENLSELDKSTASIMAKKSSTLAKTAKEMLYEDIQNLKK